MKEASRRFLPIGHLYERTTKTGNPYLTGKIAEQQVFLFLQDDGSWKVFLQVEEERAPAAEAPPLSDDGTAYDQTLAGVDVPDYDEPVRPPSVRERGPSRSATRKTAHGSPVRGSSRAEEG
jgi:hypothetical protein